jgi:DNA-binding transcriptional MerR regulator
MKRKYSTFSKGLDYLESQEKEPLELIRNPKYRRKDLGVEARVLNHWDKMDLLLKKNVNSAVYTFSLAESFWIKMIQKLRAYNLPLEIIKEIKEELNAQSEINLNSKIDPELIEFLLSKETDFEKNQIEKFLQSTEFLDLIQKLKPTLLENILIDLILTRSNHRILVNENGEVHFFSAEKYIPNDEYNVILNEFLSKTYLSISLFEIIKELIKDLGEDECSEYQNILTKDEAMVLKLLKQDDISKIEISFNDKTKKAETIKVTKNSSVSNFNKVQDLILRNGYQDISIKTQKGKVVHCTNTTKYKLDTE